MSSSIIYSPWDLPPKEQPAYFEYSRLENPDLDLRLLSIEPGRLNDPIRCNIQSYPPSETPEYFALSYVWGESTGKVAISLDGHDILITSNLAGALRNFRQLTLFQPKAHEALKVETYFWIDAICIDQANLEERDEQVRQMKRIYQNALRVIIWLGEYEDPADANLRASIRQWGLGELQQCDRLQSQNIELLITGIAVLHVLASDHSSSSKWKEFIASTPSLFVSHGITQMQNWLQLARLFHRPWFERLWIIQELGACPNAIVQWGRSSVSWKNLEAVAAYILRPPPDIPIILMPNEITRILPIMGAHRLTQVALNSMRDIDKGNILTALWHTRGARCSDPRDRLYAILGVVDDIKDIQIDYASPVESVYRNWAFNRIKRTQSLDILSACADSSRYGLPSWVPDLRQPWGQDKSLWIWTINDTQTFRDLSGDRLFFFSDSDSILSVNGQYLSRIVDLTDAGDVVSDLADPTNLTPRLQTIITAWENWAITKRATSISVHFTDADSINFQKEVFETALLRGHTSIRPNNGYSGSTRYRFWRENGHSSIVGNVEGELFSVVHGNQVFATAGGNLGMVAGDCGARVGDQLWLLMGGLTPFILRPDNLGRGFRLITPCYFLNHMMRERRDAVAGPM